LPARFRNGEDTETFERPGRFLRYIGLAHPDTAVGGGASERSSVTAWENRPLTSNNVSPPYGRHPRGPAALPRCQRPLPRE
jgi:hypothetical protein